MSRDSDALFDALADHYDEHFAVPHRRAYDDLAWRACLAALPPPPGQVVDVGCGVGRWSQRLTGLGYHVVGIEPAPRMAAAAARRMAGRSFSLLPCPAEQADLVPGGSAAVLAMGSLQYADDVGAAVRRVAGWVQPGGVLCVLVDSLVALAVELLRAGRPAEATRRLATRRGLWRVAGLSAELHLLDGAGLRRHVEAAGLVPEALHGLLVGAAVHGREELNRALQADYAGTLAAEWDLASCPELVDLGKQLLVVARRP